MLQDADAGADWVPIALAAGGVAELHKRKDHKAESEVCICRTDVGEEKLPLLTLLQDIVVPHDGPAALARTLLMNFLQTARMSEARVAENIITCFSWGVSLKMSWTSARMSAKEVTQHGEKGYDRCPAAFLRRRQGHMDFRHA